MTKQCSKCKKPAVTFIRYNGTHLCKNHFIQYFERRIKKDVKKQGKTPQKVKIGVAVSGGKDSLVAFHIINDIFSKRPHMDIAAITVDEGISSYRDKSVPFAVKNCEELRVQHCLISFEDIVGKTMDEIASYNNDLGACSFCGVFRRLCLNQKSRDLGIDKLVTGHNLDDTVQSILMNFVNGDLQKLARLAPHNKIQPGLVPRLHPLRSIPEKEVVLYAILKQIEYYDGECPYSTQAYRGVFRDIIDHLEFKNPGTRHSILKSYDGIKNLLLDKFLPVELNQCARCGEPTTQDLCKACIMKEKIS